MTINDELWNYPFQKLAKHASRPLNRDGHRAGQGSFRARRNRPRSGAQVSNPEADLHPSQSGPIEMPKPKAKTEGQNRRPNLIATCKVPNGKFDYAELTIQHDFSMFVFDVILIVWVEGKQWPLAPNSPKWRITRANVSRRVTFFSKMAFGECERMYRVRGKWLANVGRMYRVRGKWLANVGRMYRVRPKQVGNYRRK